MSWTREQALVVDADPQTRAVVIEILAAEGYDVRESDEIGAAAEALRSMERGVVLTELDLPGGSGMELLAQARQRYPDVGVVLVSRSSDAEAAVQALQDGALDYVVKPATSMELEQRITR